MILQDNVINALCNKDSDGKYIYKQYETVHELGDAKISKITGVIKGNDRPMITPFKDSLVRVADNGSKIISYGLSSMGYDVSLGESIKIFTNVNSDIIDPMEHNGECFIDAKIKVDDNGLRYFILPPNSYALGHTEEIFSIPREVIVLCLGKSTLARSGILLNTTPIEPGFEGQVVIEMANGCNSPVKIYIDGGIAQFVFMKALAEPNTSYADREGKYQGQRGIVHSKV